MASRSASRLAPRLAGLLLAGAALVGPVAPAAAVLRVVASLPDEADLARQIGGDRVEVTTIAEGTQDPHKVPVKPSFVVKLNRADALVAPSWNALCARGVDLEVDVGFPTVSLPVEVALWTGLSQTQTGILFHSGYPLQDPLGPRAIPAQAAAHGGSIAVAESHPYIVQSLGFGMARPALDAKAASWDGKPPQDDWGRTWRAESMAVPSRST